MKTPKISLKTVFFSVIIFVLFLPMIQQNFSFPKLKELKGSFEKTVAPTLSYQTWFSGEFQAKEEKYLNENLGFRSFFVRVYNQIHYSLFNHPRAYSVLVGQNDYLYEENYIKAYYGIDFIGDSTIQEKVRKLKKIEEALAKNNTTFMVVFAPGKGSFYPEFIPTQFLNQEKKTTNYEVYCREIQKSGLTFIDFNKWFREMKSTSPYPLMPKTGIHWSKYGELLAADSLIKFIQKKRNIQLPTFKITKINTSTEMKYSDNDIESGMNLLFDMPNLEMAYPDFEIDDKNASKPKAIVVADSYYWEMFNWGISKRIFNEGKFWYYHQEIYPDNFHAPLKVSDINIKSELDKTDVVILMATDANLYKFAFGFIEDAYDVYYGNGKITTKEQKIAQYIQAIKNSPNWLEQVKKDAIKDAISLDEAILGTAKYMVWQEEQKQNQEK